MRCKMKFGLKYIADRIKKENERRNNL